MAFLAAFLTTSRTGDDTWIYLFLLIVILAVLGARKKRSRAIPVKSKRLALAKFFQEHYSDAERSNKKLRLRDYEFDHIRPFSRGGTHDSENIRVIPKTENRRKGAKMP